MSQQQLHDYIKNAREQKATDDAIRAQLVKFGWKESDVDQALGKKGETNLPAPPVPQIGMWISFQYVLMFISLYVAATSLAGILNIAVDTNMKDPLDNISYYGYGNNFSEGLVRGYIAGLIVAFPIFAFLFLRLTNLILTNPVLRGLRARKILIYLTLVITFIIMLFHMILIIYDLLSGSASARSFGHLVVTLLVAGSIFYYLLQDVREDRKGV